MATDDSTPVNTDPDDIPSYDQLHRETLAALRDILRDRQAPAAARAAAAKELRQAMDNEKKPGKIGDTPPTEMTLDEIDAELAAYSTAGSTIQ